MLIVKLIAPSFSCSALLWAVCMCVCVRVALNETVTYVGFASRIHKFKRLDDNIYEAEELRK
jgi:hypothetical protein